MSTGKRAGATAWCLAKHGVCECRGFGAFTGADPKGRKGKLALANGGTLFLDEIGDMPVRMQVKLLRALQEKEIEPLGSNKVVPLNVRIVAATSRDLEQMVAEGSFRADLYYRLNVIPIAIPPLRERIEDSPELADALLEDVCKAHGLTLKELTKSAYTRLPALRGTVTDVERRLIQDTLVKAQGNKQEAARMLGISRSTLYKKIDLYKVEESH